MVNCVSHREEAERHNGGGGGGCPEIKFNFSASARACEKQKPAAADNIDCVDGGSRWLLCAIASARFIHE